MSYKIMQNPVTLDLTQAADTLKAAAEHSRLRILILLSAGDLSVSDLTHILKQSQPRVSRHLKVLLDARLIGRYQEGAWAYFRLTEAEPQRALIDALIAPINTQDPEIERDFERLTDVREERQRKASDYFAQNAASWDALRSLHASDEAIEAAMLNAVTPKPFQSLLDLGTGTGQMLSLFAPYYARAVGVDLSRDMLMMARAKLEKEKIANATVRHGTMLAPPVERGDYDVITMHQVLHYLDDPSLAIREAARALRAGGCLLIVDFQSHDLEYLREQHAHVRLGFTDAQIERWCSNYGLDLVDTQSFEPQKINDQKNQHADKLIVKLWVVRDPRQLLADGDTALENIPTGESILS